MIINKSATLVRLAYGAESFSNVIRTYSAHVGPMKRKTIADIYSLYDRKEPISVVTGYDYITGKFAEKADIDINLIGDSLAMTALGYEDTNQISIEEMSFHAKAVSRGNKSSFLIVDMPFGSFEESPELATRNAIKLLKDCGAQAVKIEGGIHLVPTVKKLTQFGIPVVGHVGLTPQQHNALGGFKLQGNSLESALDIYKDCLELQKAGAVMFILECVPNRLAGYITSHLKVPTIGIGAGNGCSGQVLVMADLLGLSGNEHKLPRFVKQYSDISTTAVEALNQYKADVKKQIFPNPEEHGYKIKKEVFSEFKAFAEALEHDISG